MDLKGTLAAISLSAAVIVLWGLFFTPDAEQVKKAQLEKERSEVVNNEDAPKLIENEEGLAGAQSSNIGPWIND